MAIKRLLAAGILPAVHRRQGRGEVRVEVIVLGGPGIVAQAQLVAELDAAEIRHVFVDRPDKLFASVVCGRVLDLEAPVAVVFIYAGIAEVIRIAHLLGRQRLAGQAPRVHPDGVELSRFGVEFFGGRADDGSVVVVVRVNIGWCFNRDGIVTATAPRVTAQDTFDGQPQTF